MEVVAFQYLQTIYLKTMNNLEAKAIKFLKVTKQI